MNWSEWELQLSEGYAAFIPVEQWEGESEGVPPPGLTGDRNDGEY